MIIKFLFTFRYREEQKIIKEKFTETLDNEKNQFKLSYKTIYINELRENIFKVIKIKNNRNLKIKIIDKLWKVEKNNIKFIENY